jgi:predicted lipase
MRFYHVIVFSRTNRQVIVVFRGSVTVRDWLVNGKLYMASTANPLKQATSVTIPQSENVGMHCGFHSYLFGNRSKRADVKSKYDQILDHVRSLLATYDGFSIMLTGHSLGGALATLCSFRMALEDDIIKPITCITFASPRTGNAAFCRAFQELELQQKIVCLRVANKRDLITKHPDRLNICTFFYQDSIFRHVGMELKLYPETKKQPNRTYQLKHVRVRRSRLSQLSDDFFRSFPNTVRSWLRCTFGCCIEDYVQLHSCEEYMTRLQRAANSLLEISLKDEYTSYHQVLRKASVYRSVIPYK